MLNTPYYLIHEKKLLENLKKVKLIRELSGAKSLLALKCFSTWSTFDLIRQYMDGTTSSSLYEARLGKEKFKKEVHAYSVAFSQTEIKKVKKYADKIIFNSLSQLKQFYPSVRGYDIGVRVNPQVSYSHFDLADPNRRYSRLGVLDKNALLKNKGKINGLMFHFNCENDNFDNFSKNIDYLTKNYQELLTGLTWVSLGGGISFTKKKYPLKKFCDRLKKFSDQFNLQIYLEPGEAIVSGSTELVTKILDITYNQINIAIVDASTEAHMLDLLIYQTPAKIDKSSNGRFKYLIAGRSCLAGDVFGFYRFKSRLKPGSLIRINDAGGYTMVKKNWFNGLRMPSIAIKRLNGTRTTIRRFRYRDFLESLS